MRPGDLVEFKAGSHGIGAPSNYGIYLDRVKRKGGFYVVLWSQAGDVLRRRREWGRKPLGHERPPRRC